MGKHFFAIGLFVIAVKNEFPKTVLGIHKGLKVFSMKQPFSCNNGGRVTYAAGSSLISHMRPKEASGAQGRCIALIVVIRSSLCF